MSIQPAPNQKKNIPWAWIGGILLVALGLITLMQGRKGVGPLASLATATSTTTPTPTNTPTSTPTSTPTNTATPTLTPTATPTPGIGSIQTNPKDNAEMVYVPAGEFEMGSASGYSHERPVHTVYLDAYWIYKYEVSNQQFAAFLNDQGNQMEGGAAWLEWDDVDVRVHEIDGVWQPDDNFDNHPIIEMTWYGAAAYCEWAEGRLPTEAEWEKAARGTDGRTYPWGEGASSSLANYGPSVGETVPIGSYPEGVSPYGALDMSGNVWEYVSDWFDADYYRISPYENPTGPEDGSDKVFRGGSWDLEAFRARTPERTWADPLRTFLSVGIRCLVSP